MGDWELELQACRLRTLYFMESAPKGWFETERIMILFASTRTVKQITSRICFNYDTRLHEQTRQVCFHTALIALAGGFMRFPAAEIDAPRELPDGLVPRVRVKCKTCKIYKKNIATHTSPFFPPQFRFFWTAQQNQDKPRSGP